MFQKLSEEHTQKETELDELKVKMENLQNAFNIAKQELMDVRRENAQLKQVRAIGN